MDTQVKLTEDSPRLTSLDELVGKTVAGHDAALTEYLVIWLTDGSYVLIKSGDEDTIDKIPDVHRGRGLYDCEKFHLGMIDAAELERREQEQLRRRAEETAWYEREAYERLKAKFESPQS